MKKYCLLFSLALLMAAVVVAKPPVSSSLITLNTKNPESRIITSQNPQFSFLFPELGGTLLFGLITGNQSKWLEEAGSVFSTGEKGALIFELKDELLGKGKLSIKAVPLKTTDGLILEICATGLKPAVELFWAYGGATGWPVEPRKASLKPEFCKNNVFVVERNDMTVFYKETVDLKVMNLLFPVETESALCDARQQSSPLALFLSGKKTDSPLLSGKFKLSEGKKYYICIYRQNKEADYNYSHLPQLFEKSRQ